MIIFELRLLGVYLLGDVWSINSVEDVEWDL